MGRPTRIGVVFSLCFAGAAYCLQQRSGGRPVTSMPTSGPMASLSFAAEAVDGVDELIVRDAEHRIEHREWQPMKNARVTVHLPFPREAGWRARIRNKVGRPSVTVMQQPSAENNYELRIRIDDGPNAGAAPLSFQVVADRPLEAKRPYNVVLVTIDSLRPDRLGCYGCVRPTSPNIDRLAKNAMRFTNAFSASSFTPPSHASLFTSRYVGDHGLLTWNPLSDEQLTLAEVLSEYDYETTASVNLNLLSEQNLGQGFATRIEGNRDGRRVVDDGLAALRRAGARPFFLWLHSYDVHRPYGGPVAWQARFSERARPGIGNGENHYNLLPGQVRERGLTEEDLTYISDRYDAGIAYIDSQLGPLLDELSSPQRLKDTIVILTADHGESMREHHERLFSHDPFLYASVTRIPLLIRLPGGRGTGTVCNNMTSLVDIAPTVLDTVGISQPTAFQGISLLPAADGGSLGRTTIFMECWGWEERKAARTTRWSVIRDMKRRLTEFFDLALDPDEQKPLAVAPDEAARALETALNAFAGRVSRQGKAPDLDPRTRDRLRALGYLTPD